nr:T-cell immunoglobulin and mucin domain-containing protein 4-like isoform X3 [Nerophis lumbriciformis]
MAGRLKLLLMIFVPAVCGSITLLGHTGQNITLPCKYDIKSHKLTPACWGLGPIPVSGCNDKIISTNGVKVQGETNRYKLLGPVSGGDVSLTILNVTKRDSGIYGCRVEIFGLFNDEIHSIHLIVNEAPQMTSTTLKTGMSAEKMAAGVTAGDSVRGGDRCLGHGCCHRHYCRHSLEETSQNPPATTRWSFCEAKLFFVVPASLLSSFSVGKHLPDG